MREPYIVILKIFLALGDVLLCDLLLVIVVNIENIENNEYSNY